MASKPGMISTWADAGAMLLVFVAAVLVWLVIIATIVKAFDP